MSTTRVKALTAMLLVTVAMSGCGNQTTSQDTDAAAGSGASASEPPPVAGLGTPRYPTPAPTSPQPEPPLGSIPTVTSNARIPMPLDPYLTSMADIDTIDLARDAAAARCMRARGFATWTDGIIQSWSPEDYLESEPLEFIDPQQAAQSGYPKPRVDTQLTALSNRPQARRAPTQEELKAYDGTRAPAKSGSTAKANGCLAEGKARLYSGQQELSADPRALDDDASTFAMQDSRVIQALTTWRNCSTGSGLNYDSPITARHDPRWAPRDADTAATAEEKRIAQIDAQCQRQINLVGIYVAAKIAYEKRMVANQRSQLQASQKIVQGWVANARSILNAP